MRSAHRALQAASVLLLLAGCKRADMYSQSKAMTWDSSRFFADGRTMRRPVPGTVSPDDANRPVPQPQAAELAMMQRGRTRFDLACAPCHGRSGDGDGMIVQRGFPRPPSFHTPALRAAKAQLFYDVITHGHGVMYSYAGIVSPSDRWAIIAYIRALQRSQDAMPDELAPQDLAALGHTP